MGAEWVGALGYGSRGFVHPPLAQRGQHGWCCVPALPVRGNWNLQGNDSWWNGLVFAFKRGEHEEEQAVASGLQQ